MSFDQPRLPALLDEARRQIEICNACRYCEGYCAVFPAMTRARSFSDGDLTHLANLCHNCRGCYYACQYTEPHEFALNIPAALADLRQESWENYVGPARLARAFHASGVAIATLAIILTSVLIAVMRTLPKPSGEGFYGVISHNVMVAIFLPAFLLPMIAVAMGLRRYWRDTGAGQMKIADLTAALKAAGTMKNLSGGQGQGCNFEKADRYSQARRHAHQAVMYGFLLCFAATSVATVMHYVFDQPAPYPLLSPPKLLGVPGGMLMAFGSLSLIALKLKADRQLGASHVWGGEMAFVVLLCATATSGLALYAATETAALPWLLALHLGSVLSFFMLLPYTKMVHGFFRLTALIAEQAIKRASPKIL